MSELPHFRRGVVMALLSSVAAAGFVVPWKLASQYGAPEICVLVMLCSATAFNTLALLLPDRSEHARLASPGLLVALASVMAGLTLLGNYLSAQAIARMSSALLSVLFRLEVFVVASLGTIVLREYVRPAFWFGACVSLFGLVVLNLRPASAELAFDRAGVLFAMGASLCFGAMAVVARKYVARLNPGMLNALRLWVSVLLWFAVTRRVPRANELPPSVLLNAALAGLFGPFLSRLAVLQSARHIPANTTSLVALSTPVFALALSAIALGTLPTQTELIGGVVMLAGIAIPFVSQSSQSRPTAG